MILCRGLSSYRTDLNIAEIELSALGRQCLGRRRIGTPEELNKEMTTWQHDRNAGQKGVDWRFTATDARIKLKRPYPKVAEKDGFR